MSTPDAGEEGDPISYKLLAPGTEVRSSDGVLVGHVESVLEATQEHIFDGLVVRTDAGERFVDAPEVARIAQRRVTLTIDAAAAAQLPEPDPAAPHYRVDAGAGRLKRWLGGGWRRH